MKGIINIESITRRTLKAMGLYYKWLFYQERKSPTKAMKKMREMYSQFVKPGNLCFDVGANMGSRVGSFLMLGSKVIAIEPQQVCMTELKKTFTGWSVEFEKKGVAASKGVLQMHIADNSLISSFSKDWIETMKGKHRKTNWNKTEEVEITTLDLLIEKYGEPDFIKIDTEGYEFEVLKGLSKKIKALSFEYTLPDPYSKTLACMNILKDVYGDYARYNISVEESYTMKFDNWKTGEEIISLLNSSDFTTDEFGGYGDIYVTIK